MHIHWSLGASLVRTTQPSGKDLRDTLCMAVVVPSGSKYTNIDSDVWIRAFEVLPRVSAVFTTTPLSPCKRMTHNSITSAQQEVLRN